MLKIPIQETISFKLFLILYEYILTFIILTIKIIEKMHYLFTYHLNDHLTRFRIVRNNVNLLVINIFGFVVVFIHATMNETTS